MNKGIQQSTIDFVVQQEGAKDKVYKDSAGIDTVGVGHVIILPKDLELTTKTLSKKEIDNLLFTDLKATDKAIKEAVKIPLNQNQYDALTSLAFNIGVNGFKNSTLVKYINAGEKIENIKSAWLSWNKIKYISNKALTDRRNREFNLYTS